MNGKDLQYWPIALAAAFISPACTRQEAPVARACEKLTAPLPGTDHRQSCICTDDVLHKQLDDAAYAALSNAAEDYVEHGGMAGSTSAVKSAQRFLLDSKGIDAPAAGADLALAIAKAATRCRW